MNRRIRVIHMVEDMKVGGQEKVIAAIATGLHSEAFLVEIWCLAAGGTVADRLQQAGISLRILNLRTYHNLFNIVRLARYLRRSKADILHTHGHFAGTFGRLAAILAGTRQVVAHVHTSDFNLSRRHILIDHILARFSQRILCVSRAVQDFITRIERIPAAKTLVVHNGTDWLFGDQGPPISRLAMGFHPHDCVLISVGSLVDNKGHQLLIDVLHLLVPEYPAMKLLIVGDGPLRGQLEESVARFDLASYIRFTGRVQNIQPLLALADIFLLPTRYREGLSMAILEAMQEGLPIIATTVGGIPEAVQDQRNGLLVEPNDVQALKAAITTLISDGKLRRAMSDAGRRIYEQQFTAEKMVSQIETFYRSICLSDEPVIA
jgi:glycosyltransferase involved in cell wall biosynthesis